ncbi:PEGA domain-containing protein [Maricaulis sp.]|uniref:PEGA domain-containing protein n=1 Tax=Maricaulis sp. TaxID=1486257 RepID=UPI003A8FCA10
MTRLAAPFLCLALVLSSCATQYPERQTTMGGDMARIAFSDAPPGATVYIDNLAYGLAESFQSGVRVLEIKAGRHRVRVEANGHVYVDREIFAGRGAVLEIDVQ